MTEENKMQIHFDMNEFMKAYSKEDFMKKVFTEFLNTKVKQVSDLIGQSIIIEVVKSELYEQIKSEVLRKLEDEIKNGRLMGSSYGYGGPFRDVVQSCIADTKPLVSKQVDSVIKSKGFKESVATNIESTVRERVMSALGEVCDGCGNDYD